MYWLIASTILAAGMATGMIFVRLKAAKKPASIKKIILPPIFMSTGAFMFLFPEFRVAWSQVAEALIVGVIFSIFLIRTSRFEIRGEEIYLKPSRGFVFILVGLLVLRIILKVIIGQKETLGETSGMFFLLAFGMIISWRIAMLRQFLQLEKKMKTQDANV
ncbi:cytochrome c biogenesis protein CcdC [Halobacillus salinarum]|uniref:Cytochrome c biogenesis protein CcdC n=1 Tax=Halobacillus salinarum TaxID=2932257 RepID=A0ABY4EES4_9BACI|nr:cytochrome c biogenesis protein CcdC [Halobacillus salinarum]UOQ42960.1 cytochrome c biogenesis protein CcdC [Halobacillus salinarum]